MHMVEINFIKMISKKEKKLLFWLGEQKFLLFLKNQYFKTYTKKLKNAGNSFSTDCL